MTRFKACYFIAIVLNIFLSVLLTTAGTAHAQAWNIDNDGEWNESGNWNPNTGFPNLPGSIAEFTNDISGNRIITISTGGGVTIGQLNIGDSAATPGVFNFFTIASGGVGGTLTFDATSGNALINKANTASNATDVISAPIILADDLSIVNSAAASGLEIAGGIGETGEARSVVKSGAGTVTFSGTNSYTGSTYIDEGNFAFSGTHSTGWHYRIGGLTASAEMTITGGSINVTDVFFTGDEGAGTLHQSGGAITAGNFSSLGRTTGVTGIHNMSGGTFTAGGDYNVGDFGTGILNMTGGHITTTNRFVIGWRASSVDNVATINGADAKITVNNPTTGAEAMFVGNFGRGVLDLHAGVIEVLNKGELNLGRENLSRGQINQFGGTITVDGIVFVGRNGTGRYDINDGVLTVGNFLSTSHNASTSSRMEINGGQINILGNTPSDRALDTNGTGNLIIGRRDTSLVNMQGGTINLQVQSAPLDTFNSAIISVLKAAQAGEPADNQLVRAKDGNLYLGQLIGTGTLNQSGGVINVGANVFVGGADFSSGKGGDGTLRILGTAQLKVGVSSPSGGDLILGSPFADTSSTVNLEGGTLDVSKGSILSGGLASSKAFTFTGGTLKVLRWNTSGVPQLDASVGSLGHLKQDGSGSMLDVTSVNTIINSNYQLGTGTATIGSNRSLTAQNVENISGAGTINVGQGGANATLTVGNGSIDVDTLHLNNGVVTGNGGVTIRTTLTGKGTINGPTTLATGASLEAGNSAGVLNFSNDLTFSIDAQMVWELSSLSTTDAGTNFDLVNVSGNLDLGTSSTLVLDFDLLSAGMKPDEGHAFWTTDHTWKIVDSASNVGATNFASVVGGIGPGTWSTTIGTHSDAGDILLHYSAVPEPSAILLGCCGVAGVIGVAVRRRRKVLAA